MTHNCKQCGADVKYCANDYCYKCFREQEQDRQHEELITALNNINEHLYSLVRNGTTK